MAGKGNGKGERGKGKRERGKAHGRWAGWWTVPPEADRLLRCAVPRRAGARRGVHGQGTAMGGELGGGGGRERRAEIARKAAQARWAAQKR